MTGKKPISGPLQSDKFVAAARELGADEDPERFKAIVRKIGRATPAPVAKKPARKKG